MTKQQLYGTWSSPITPASVRAGLRLNDVQWANDALVWVEGRGGQTVLVAQRGIDAPFDLTDAAVSVRGRVGYGGGEFATHDDAVYFAGNGGRLYRLSLGGGLPQPITPAFGSAASPCVSRDGKWIAYVHSYENVDGLALVDSSGDLFPRKLAYGSDFVMQPAWHPQGTHIAYIAWDQPQMPWDGTRLQLITLAYGADGVPAAAHIDTLAGDDHTSVFQPEFSPDGKTLLYASDQSGWWQLYLYDLAARTHTQITDAEAEHAIPAWVQGVRQYAWSNDGKGIYYIRLENNVCSLWRYDRRNRQSRPISGLGAYTYLKQIAASSRTGQVALIASSSAIPDRIVTLEIERDVIPVLSEPTDPPSIHVIVDDNPESEIVRQRSQSEMLRDYYVAAQPIEWPTHDDALAYGLYYPPHNPEYASQGAPPLIVKVHGGPTSQTYATFSAEVQFYTTRGFAVLEVNHRGSSGYGRAYRDKLIHAWGEYDVEDSASGAQFLVDRGYADPRRLVILGGSAGGYTVLQSLVSKPGFWRAGVCLYGISNQFTLALANPDWKFEARYSDMLLGTLPEAEALYRERSPLFNADKIKDAVIIFHGEDDPVVPKAQADSIVAALKRRGVPHEYHVFAGEGHGWRKPETIERYYTLALNFLQQYVIYG